MEVSIEKHRSVVSSPSSSSKKFDNADNRASKRARIWQALFIICMVAGLISVVTVLIVRTNAVDPNSSTDPELEGESFSSTSPTLSADELSVAIEAYEARREATRVARANMGIDQVLRAYQNLTVSDQWVRETVSNIKVNEVADFEVMNLIRLLAYTDEFDDVILPTLQEIVSWPAEGNSNPLYVYWSENHAHMWLCALQITHEWYGWPVQEDHDFRLRFFLKQKVEHGFYEFFSAVYMPFTFSALATLYDFSADSEIRDLAQAAATRLLQDLDLITNEKGGLFAVAGRNYKEYVESNDHTLHTMAWLLTGRGADLNVTDTGFSTGAIAMATTTLNVSAVLEWPILQAELTRWTGHNHDDFQKVWGALGEPNKQLMAMSMGGYAHPDYVASLFSTLNYFDLWDSKYFKDYETAKWVPAGGLQFAAKIASTFGASTLLYAQIVLYKYRSSMLSTLQDYQKGLNGEQQWPFVATAGLAPVYIATGDLNSRNPSVHLPFAKQKENVALLAYSPNSDLKTFARNNLDVTLVWPEDSFSESSREQGNWLIGREDSSYVAVYRSCLDKNGNGLPTCSAFQQVWACVVGHEDTHGSYDAFVAMLEAAKLEVAYDKGYISANIDADGQAFSLEWQQENVAPAHLALIISTMFLVFAIASTVFACIYIEVPELSEKERDNRKKCVPLRNRLRCLQTKSGACLFIVWIAVVIVFILSLIAVLVLANDSHVFSRDSAPSQV